MRIILSYCAAVPTGLIVEASGVTFAHGERLVLDNVSLQIARGGLCALVGPNGSGKTTLVRLLLNLLAPQQGEVRYPDGAARVGYVPQRTRLDAEVPATVAEIVSTGLLGRRERSSRTARHDALASALEQVGLGDRASSRVGELSGGQQQRVMIARALIAQPQLLVLDEPVAGVDVDSQRAFHDVLEQQVRKGTAVLLVSHELSAVADLVTRIVVLRHQRIEFDGDPQNLSSQGISLGVHAHDLPVWLERP